MGKGSAKNRVDDLQSLVVDQKIAREEGRSIDVALLEEQIKQTLNDLRSDLNQPSPASSFQQDFSLGSLSAEINKLWSLGEEEDDATSALAASEPKNNSHKVATDNSSPEGFNVNQGTQRQEFQLNDYCIDSHPTGQNFDANPVLHPSHLEYNHSYNLHQEVGHTYSSLVDPLMYGEDTLNQDFGYLPNMCPPPSAFLGPKCLLWDCLRPAQEFMDYCSSHHAGLALSEGSPGMTPVLRPRGIDTTDGPLFAVLNAKSQAKDVGVPECEGAVTTKSPWNAPELFDLILNEGESIREWLFFDKPRRAFESGNRKQRSLPDYKGRGWHVSRKQEKKEFGGLKSSYYMDPQPRKDFDWHLYEYEINNFDDWALYRLEFKRVDGKKGTKGKPPNDSVADLQKQMGKLTAESSTGNKRSGGKSRAKASPIDKGENAYYSVPNQVRPTIEVSDYLVDDTNGYYFDVAS